MTRGQKKATNEPTRTKRGSFRAQVPFTNTFCLSWKPIIGMGSDNTERKEKKSDGSLVKACFNPTHPTGYIISFQFAPLKVKAVRILIQL